jgi:uncharacterized RDD family membrane protein YckC
MKWYYANAGVQAGPVDEAELDRLVGQGVVRGDTLVWNEGMPSWQPLGVVRGWPNTSAPAAVAMPGVASGHVRYAGFWIRFLARLIDGVLLGVINAVIRIPLGIMLGAGFGGAASLDRGPASLVFLPAAMGLIGISVIISIALGVAYEVYFVSTRGGTIGKLVLGLRIVRADGAPITTGLALGRYFAQWLSAAILMIGYIMAGFDAEKRALHDHICQTRVIHSR